MQRRRWIVAVVLPAVAVGVTGCGWTGRPASADTGPRPASSLATAAQPAATVASVPTIAYPRAGAQQWRTAAGDPAVAGHDGTLLRYRVVVETGITGVDPDAFAATVTATLSDPRSWIAGGHWRLRRVGPGEPYDFTVYLVTPATRDVLCGDGVDGYTSCRNGDRVVLNVARWAHGVPDYGAPLDVYRQYMVNHEVGHRLGHDHQRCPGPGEKAPVMEQQTLGLHGCVANPWPYPDGTLLAGPPGAYDDPVPAQP